MLNEGKIEKEKKRREKKRKEKKRKEKKRKENLKKSLRSCTSWQISDGRTVSLLYLKSRILKFESIPISFDLFRRGERVRKRRENGRRGKAIEKEKRKEKKEERTRRKGGDLIFIQPQHRKRCEVFDFGRDDLNAIQI